MGLFTSVADNGGTIVALPTISDHFGADLPTVQWVVIGYALTISALLLPMGRLSDIIGRKRIYLLGFSIFVAGAVLAGSSSSITMLILSRVVMGIGSAMTQGTSMAMVVAAFSDQERGKSLGLQMSVVGIGGVAGPAVGGLIVGELGWRAVFYITAFMGGLSLIAAYVILDGRRAPRGHAKAAFDWVGAALSSSALIVFLLAMTSGPRLGWDQPGILAGFGVVAVLLAGFVLWELRAPSPMLDVRLFSRRLFSLGVTASFISFIGGQSARFLLPFYLQAVLGFRPREVGLILVPAAIVMIITGPLGGRLSDRYGWTRFNVGGLLLTATGLFILSRLTVGSPVWMVILGMVATSAGMGTFSAPNNSSILSAVERSKYGVVSGFLNLVRNSANVTGIAIATAIVTAVMASQGFPPSLSEVSREAGAGLLSAFTDGLRIAYMIIATLVLVGAVLSVFKGGTVEEAQPRPVERVNQPGREGAD
ncbi:MAG: MFS transporter [Chloroflexi bacterium]|nr:MFS transporter [Chloroflexota bacterium]